MAGATRRNEDQLVEVLKDTEKRFADGQSPLDVAVAHKMTTSNLAKLVGRFGFKIARSYRLTAKKTGRKSRRKS